MPRKQKFTVYASIRYPDGTIREAFKIDDVLGERSVTQIMPIEEQEAAVEKMLENIGRTMSSNKEFVDKIMSIKGEDK